MRRSQSDHSDRNRSSPVLLAAISVWALLLGMLMLMLGNGLQGTLIGVRATGEGFSTNVTGLVMSGYFIGFLAGSKYVPALMGRVGHLRVFAALAALASVAILTQSLIVQPWVWLAMRLVTGFTFAGVYIVAESWLNDRVTNEHRGGLLSIYMIISYLGLTGGQLLLNLADPMLGDLFIVVAILISLASVPILLVATTAPSIRPWQSLGPWGLFRLCHLGAVGAAFSGIAAGALLGMGPVFAAAIGLSIGEISVFMALLVGAGAVAHYPIGKLSDRFDRCRVIMWVAVIGTAAALLAALICVLYARPPAPGLIAAGMVVGAASLALYPLFAAHTNDLLEPDQIVGAGSSLIMLFGAGAIAGPLLAGQAMQRIGVSGFFWALFATLGLLCLYTIWRRYRLGPLDVSRQTRWMTTPLRTAGTLPAWLREQASRRAAPQQRDSARGGAPVDPA